MKFDGDATYITKSGKKYTIDGEGNLPDEIELKKLDVDGDVSFDEISCDEIKITGECRGNALTAEKVFIDGDIKVDVIKVDKTFEADGDCFSKSLTAEKIFIDGDSKVDVIKAAGTFEINGSLRSDSIESDEVIIESRSGTVGKIKCTDLKISKGDEDFEGEIYFGNVKIKTSSKKISSRIQIKDIEAETVNLQNCEVGIIKCKNAFIGSNCVIEKLIVASEYEIYADAKVSEIIHMNFDK